MTFRRADRYVWSWRYPAVLLLLGVGAPGFAQMQIADPAFSQRGSTVLKISPRSCLSASAQSVCLEQLTVTWQSDELTALCLWRGQDEQPLFCVDSAKGERILTLAISASTRFYLRPKLSQQSDKQTAGYNNLASAELIVLAAPDATLRRRYRHPWSVF